MVKNKSQIISNQRLVELRKKFEDFQKSMEAEADREKFTSFVVESVNLVLGESASFLSSHDDIDMREFFPSEKSFTDWPGLVLAYAHQDNVQRVVRCCDEQIGMKSGKIGFFDYHNIGYVIVSNTNLTRVFELAKTIRDTIVFVPDEMGSSIFVDFYDSCDCTFAVHGDLEQEMKQCFDHSNLVRLSKRPSS